MPNSDLNTGTTQPQNTSNMGIVDIAKTDPTSAYLADILGWVADQLKTIRNLHYLLIFISIFSVTTWMSIEPRNFELERQFLSLRDELGISGRTSWSAVGFYNWIFADQLINSLKLGNYVSEINFPVRFEPIKSKEDFLKFNLGEDRSKQELFGKTLDSIKTMAIVGRIPESATVNPLDIIKLSEWKLSVKNAGKTYNGDFWLTPWYLPNESIYKWVRCFHIKKNGCQEIVESKDAGDALHRFPNAPDKDYFLLIVEIQLKSTILYPSSKWLDRHASQLFKLLDDNPALKNSNWEDVADVIFSPLIAKSTKLTLPLLDLEVSPKLMLPSLIILLFVTQLYFFMEFEAVSRYADYVLRTWPTNRPLFFSPWIGARSELSSISIAILTVAIFPLVSWSLLLVTFLSSLFNSFPGGYTLEGLEARASDTLNLPAIFVTATLVVFMLIDFVKTFYSAKSIRQLSTDPLIEEKLLKKS